MRQITLKIVAITSLLLLATTGYAQHKKKSPPAKTGVKNQNITQAQGQVQGGDGVFGTTYTLNSGINFSVLKARYVVEPHNSYERVFPGPGEKLLILTCAAKNANKEDASYGGQEFQAVDEEGHDYPSSIFRLASTGSKAFGPNLKPGQGFGQFPDKDELTVSITLPSKARVSKIILKAGRKFVKNEEVVRYFISDVATKERDGAVGNPKNTISPLPDFVKDPADKQGATALTTGIGKMATAYPSSYFAMTVDSIELSNTAKLNDISPDEGKTYAIATITVKNISPRAITLFDVGEVFYFKDADGEKYTMIDGSGRRKPKRDEAAPSEELQVGDSYTFRAFMLVPKDVKLKSFYFGTEAGRRYTLDLPK